MRKKRPGAPIPDTSTPVTKFSSLLRIAIATAPKISKEGITLAEDIRLVKPALLYADVVKLYSPSALMLLSSASLAQLTARERMQFLTQIYPLFDPHQAPLLFEMLETDKQLEKRKKTRSREELLTYHRLRPKLEKLKTEIDRIWTDELVPQIEQQLEATGANQLTSAISAGLLEVDPLTKSNKGFNTDQVIEAFVEKLATVLSERGTYPLFDDRTGTLVRHAVAEGAFSVTPPARERGKQVAMASEFLGRLPAFPRASVAEILDIRNELQAPLVRFRAAMVEFGILIESATFEEGFAEQVDELYRLKVQPALVEIEEQVRTNNYLRVLVGEVIGDSKTLLAGVIGIGIAQAADIPNLIVGAAAASQAFLKTAWAKHENAQRNSEKELYFLYRTEQLLVG